MSAFTLPSARETAARTVVGYLSKQLLARAGSGIVSHVVSIGSVLSKAAVPELEDADRIDADPVRCLDPQASQQMVEAIDQAIESKDTLGGVFEVGFTTSLRFVEGFRNLPWTLAFLGSVTLSMALLEYAARTIPMGTAYAVWAGIGAIGTVVVGMVWFDEPATSVRLLLILVIVACIAGLKLTTA